MIDAEMLKINISMESYNLKTLSKSLKELNTNLEFCPCNGEIHQKLLQIEFLSEQIREIVETMEAMKSMSVI